MPNKKHIHNWERVKVERYTTFKAEEIMLIWEICSCGKFKSVRYEELLEENKTKSK